MFQVERKELVESGGVGGVGPVKSAMDVEGGFVNGRVGHVVYYHWAGLGRCGPSEPEDRDSCCCEVRDRM